MTEAANILAALFSHLCGQGRCFAIDGCALPLCQRCLGLYIGAAVTFAWLLATGLWRMGLPGRRVFAVQMAFLALALLGGTHALDPGPRWRLACGLWTGHVLATWLAGAYACLWNRLRGLGEPPARRLHDLAGIAAPALLGLGGLLWPLWAGLGWWPLSLIALAGAAVLAASAAAGLILLAALAARRRTRGRLGAAP